MAARLPLSALLSQTLVAFTIEFDNEAEHRIPHRTTVQGRSVAAGPAPWLVSMAMWMNCMRFVPEQGITVRELECRARARTNWNGMIRWRYIYLEPAPDDPRPKPPQSAMMVRATAGGRAAQQIWAPLGEEIATRWKERFGAGAVDGLRASLAAIAVELPAGLPDCLPILGYGLYTRPLDSRRCPGTAEADVARLSLPELLARALAAFAVEFELESEVSLAIGANVLRVMDEDTVRVRDLPLRSGVSKEAIAMALSFLTTQGYATVQAEARGSRVPVLLLTAKGVEAQERYRRVLRAVEKRWAERWGAAPIERLRAALEPLAGKGTAEDSPLFAGLEPYPEGWRARARKPATLPHFPMVLHRGGYPDGS